MWRREAPHVLGALTRRWRDFDAGEDACQEALLAAALQWPVDGVPDNPRGWLLRVASRRLVDHWRSVGARERREEEYDARRPGDERHAAAADNDVAATDDTLLLLLHCCHPALTRPAQLALALRAVGGLSTRQVAAGLLVPEATAAQRISRAKATLRAVGARFDVPPAEGLTGRLGTVRHVLYLMFTEGHTASAGEQLQDVSLTREAIRLTRQARAVRDDAELTGLLALMLLTDARRSARVDPAGDLVVLAEQDRGRWDRAAIEEGIALVSAALPRGDVGPYQLQAAIAAVHSEAPTWTETDWPQIAVLYAMLERAAPAPVVTLNAAVAEGMALGADAGLRRLEPLLADPTLRRHHRLYAVRGHLLERAGRTAEARSAYERAAGLTASIPEQRYLNARAARLSL